MHEVKEKMNRVEEMRRSLMDLICGQQMTVMEQGQVVDMVKDSYEMEKDAYEACYYKKLLEQMEKAKEENERFGYDHWRYASGRFAPKGSGRYSAGYIPMEKPDWMPDEMYGYSTGGNMSSGGRGGSRSNSSGYDKYGKAYGDWDEARRHYTASNSMADKEMMSKHGMEAVNDTIAAVRDIYHSSEPEQKKRIKAAISALVNEMPA